MSDDGLVEVPGPVRLSNFRRRTIFNEEFLRPTLEEDRLRDLSILTWRAVAACRAASAPWFILFFGRARRRRLEDAVNALEAAHDAARTVYATGRVDSWHLSRLRRLVNKALTGSYEEPS